MQQNRVRKINNGWVKMSGISNFSLEQEPDNGQGYRILHNHFGKCLQNFAKSHKQCLGEIQIMYLGKTHRQETDFIQYNKQRFIDKYNDRLVKEMLTRNSFISKEINKYIFQFKAIFNKQLHQDNLIQDYPIKYRFIRHYPRETQYKNLIKVYFRPLSSSIVGSSFSTNEKNDNDYNPPKQSNKSMSIQKTQRRKSKKNEEEEDKVIPTVDIYPKKDKLYFLDQQKLALNLGKVFKPFTPSFNPRTIKKNPSITRQIYQKLIYEKKQEMHSKVLSINSVLVVNFTKPQGYKPRSQCWRKNSD